jgi:hypothetical protein
MIKISLNLDIESQIKKQVEIKKNKIVESLISRLKQATPVDTGNARDSWKVQGKSIVNDAEYIEYLNMGSSVQAPSNFIEITLLTQTGVNPNGTVVKLK